MTPGFGREGRNPTKSVALAPGYIYRSSFQRLMFPEKSGRRLRLPLPNISILGKYLVGGREKRERERERGREGEREREGLPKTK